VKYHVEIQMNKTTNVRT